MNIIQRFAVKLAARINPDLDNALKLSGGTIEHLGNQLSLYRQMEATRLSDRDALKQELIEAAGMAGSGPWQGTGVDPRNVAVSESDSSGVRRIKERLADLELALDNQYWQRQLAYTNTEFSRWGIQQIILISRLYFIKNPLIRRGVKISAMYVFGRGIEVSSEDEGANDVIQAFLNNPANLIEWSHSGMVEKEEQKWTDGNIFLALFTNVSDGSVVTRTIDPLEIDEIISDPDDAAIPFYYRRRWTSMEFDQSTGTQSTKASVAWYVALDYTPKTIPAQIGSVPVMRTDAGVPVRVLHFKAGGLPKWRFGCPKVYSILDWARAYKGLMEDWCTLTRALARFAWQVESNGGAPALANLKQALQTTLGANGGISAEQNPAPVTGSAFITGPGNKLTPVKTAGTTTNPEEGRRVMLMVAAGFGLPETFFGDASTGSLATAQSLDRPTELQFLQEQEHWREMLQRMFTYVLQQSAIAPSGKFRESLSSRGVGSFRVVEAKKKTKAKDEIAIKVNFPSVLEHDRLQAVQSIVEAMTLGNKGGQVTGIDEKIGVRLLLEEFGVEDPEVVLEAMYPDAEYKDLIDRTKQEEQQAPVVPLTPLGKPADPNAPQPNPAAPPKKKPVNEALIEKACKQLIAAVEKLKEAA